MRFSTLAAMCISVVWFSMFLDEQPAAADDRLPASYLGFDPGSLIVARRSLPGHPAVFGDMPDMLVSLAIAAGYSVFRRRETTSTSYPKAAARQSETPEPS
ncbi:hypothetical protein HFO57_35695 [Rhizobium leguminosarum]|nr:hypothetical protein [Rhizobium leguminosarum]